MMLAVRKKAPNGNHSFKQRQKSATFHPLLWDLSRETHMALALMRKQQRNLAIKRRLTQIQRNSLMAECVQLLFYLVFCSTHQTESMRQRNIYEVFQPSDQQTFSHTRLSEKACLKHSCMNKFLLGNTNLIYGAHRLM